MKRLCAWCGRELDQVERWETPYTTHGLCAECRVRHFGSEESKESDPKPIPQDAGQKTGPAGSPGEASTP